MSASTWRRLEKLAGTGYWGSKASQVMTSLVEAGVRQAIKDGFLKPED